jgi:hypothetical protein
MSIPYGLNYMHECNAVPTQALWHLPGILRATGVGTMAPAARPHQCHRAGLVAVGATPWQSGAACGTVQEYAGICGGRNGALGGGGSGLVVVPPPPA